MRNNTRHLLLSEIHSANSYLNRLLTVVTQVSSIDYHPRFKAILSELSFSISGLLEEKLFNPSFINTKNDQAPLGNKEILKTVKSFALFFESLVEFDLEESAILKLATDYINLVYSYSNKLHVFVIDHASMEVEYPRLGIVQASDDGETAHTGQAIPRFFLPTEMLENFNHDNVWFLNSLEWQRQKKYEEFLQKGHQAISNKHFDKALEYFNRACHYKENAEIFTLLGWVNHLLGQTEIAKNSCLKAIQIDPDYGPPYNDMGTYLMSEGKLDECLKWFTMAKSSANYPNREFPYINSGRVYFTKKEYSAALEEFNKALSLVPFNDELKDTIQKIRTVMEKEQGLRKN